MSEIHKPKCFGEFWESNPSCAGCSIMQSCAEELVNRILEGRSSRQSAIISLGGNDEI